MDALEGCMAARLGTSRRVNPRPTCAGRALRTFCNESRESTVGINWRDGAGVVWPLTPS
jgi:hypothetical protein